MQVLSPSPAAVYSGMTNAVARISSTEGLRTLWRGVASVIAGAGPAHAVQFGTLEAVKEFLGKQEGGAAWASTGEFWILLYPAPLHTVWGFGEWASAVQTLLWANRQKVLGKQGPILSDMV